MKCGLTHKKMLILKITHCYIFVIYIKNSTKLHTHVIFFHPSSSFHWWSWWCDRQHSDNQQSSGAGVSGHWNTRTCHHVRSPLHAYSGTHAHTLIHCKTYSFAGGIKMENRFNRVRGWWCQPTVGGWSFPALRCLTQRGFSVWPQMKQESMRGTSMWLYMVKNK